MIDSARIDKLIEPLRGNGESARLDFGTVSAVDGSTLVVAANRGGTIYAHSYVYAEHGDTVALLTLGSTSVAFAAKDAARLERELEQAGIGYEAGAGINISDRVISADVTQGTIDGIRNDVIPVSVIEAL